MDAFYFGPQDDALLGFHHPPTGSSLRESAIVICHPIGHEFIKTYSAIKTLAQQLAARGNHVLRFDYHGTGDSAGRSNEISIARWISDIEQACHEISEITGIERPCLVGARFGGLLAYAASESCGVSRLVMLHPVLDGAAYLERLMDMHEKMLLDEDRFHFNESSILSTEDELLGHPFPADLRQEMKALSVRSLAAPTLTSLDLFSTDAPDADDLGILRQGGGTAVRLHQSDEIVDWQDVETIEDQVIISQSIKAIAGLSF